MPQGPARFNPADFPVCALRPLRLRFFPWIGHIPFAMALIDAARPRTFVELGTFAGDSYCGFCQAVRHLQLDTRCFAVDTWEGDEQAGPLGSKFLADLRAHHDPLYGHFSTLLQMTFDQARARFEPGSIDLLHIDGLHTYDAVRHDFETYLPALSDRAIVLFHDTHVREDATFGVWRFWDEIRAKYPHFHFTHNHGLGVLAVGPNIPQAVQPLFNAIPDDQDKIRAFFAAMGLRVTQLLENPDHLSQVQEQLAHHQRTSAHFERVAEHQKRRSDRIEGEITSVRTELDTTKKQLSTTAAELVALSRATSRRRFRRPRRIFTLEHLQPVRELKRSAEAEHWESTGNDPYFFIPAELPAGWLYIVLEIETDAAGPALLFLDTGKGFSDAECFTLGEAHNVRLVIDTHIPLDKPLHALRLDPQSSTGSFTIRRFLVRYLSPKRFLLRAGRALLRQRRKEGRLSACLMNGVRYLFQRGLSNASHKTISAAMTSTGAAILGYQRWCKAREITPEVRADLQKAAAKLTEGPLLSIVMPVYNTPEPLLHAAVDSVLRQVYPRWELLLIDDKSPAPHIRPLLENLATTDPRIKVQFRDANGGISAASNDGIHAATGDFVVLMDHDDEITEHALLSVAQELAQHPDADILYSDEDKLAPDGSRSYPFFKPDFSPEYLLTCNYVSHLGVYRSSLLRSIGGFRPEFDGAQDFDLLLRAVVRTTHDRIRHIPDVLYHWRMIETSTASSAAAKPKADAAGRRALQEYLPAAYPGFPAEVEPGPTDTWHRVRFPLQGSPKVSIIIPSKCDLVEYEGDGGGKRYHLEHCVNSILEKTTYKNIEILAVDRHTMPADLEQRLAAKGVKRVTYDFPFNWSMVNNVAAAQATGDHLLFLNDDMEVITPDWIENMLEFSQLPDIGAVGAKLLWHDRRIQHAGVILFNNLPSHAFYGCKEQHADHAHSTLIPRNYSAVTGACLMTRRDVFFSPDINQFSEEFPLAYNDVDYCLKVHRAGKRIVFTPHARLYHLESATRSPDVKNSEVKLFLSRWPELGAGDPYYNPHLSKTYLDFRVIDTPEPVL